MTQYIFRQIMPSSGDIVEISIKLDLFPSIKASISRHLYTIKIEDLQVKYHKRTRLTDSIYISADYAIITSYN
jgi:hypothetical protein